METYHRQGNIQLSAELIADSCSSCGDSACCSEWTGSVAHESSPLPHTPPCSPDV